MFEQVMGLHVPTGTSLEIYTIIKIRDKIFNGPNKICENQPLKNSKCWYCLFVDFNKFYWA